ncbi:glycosyltransferase [Ectobacillus ponti]|uniref:Glycosyltransferase n=1 Tax=Ectobacillus ponti TaxID=2961894 RepID=A0AA42BQQ0_9BACI|nr:glycosyltransferase [Ectobacillus ponti]
MVSVITCTIRDEMIENVFSNYANQLWEEKELIIILNNDTMNMETWIEKSADYDNVSIFRLPEMDTLGDCLNYGIEKARYDIVAKFDDDDYYSPYYLTEAMDAFKKYNPQLVGKGSSYMYFEEENLLVIRKIGNENKLGSSTVKGGTLVFKKSLYPGIQFPSIKGNGTDTGFLKECKKQGVKMYASSRYNYVYIRRGNPESHTFKKETDFFKKKSQVIGTIKDFEHIATKRMEDIQ